MPCDQFIYHNEYSGCCAFVNGHFRCDWLSHFFDDYWYLFVQEPYSKESADLLLYLYTNIISALADENEFHSLPESLGKFQLKKLIDLINCAPEFINPNYLNWIDHLVEELKFHLNLN